MKHNLKKAILVLLALSLIITTSPTVLAKSSTKYNVKFSGNGATSGKMVTIKNLEYGKTYTIPNNTFKKKGYVFTGWNTSKDGYSKSYENSACIKNLTKKDKKTVTLYAQWKRSLKVYYSNLNDKASVKQVKEYLTSAGVSSKRQKVLFDHINQFNKAVDKTKLKSNINKRADILNPAYDPYDYAEQWGNKNPDFDGYNCRITAFGLIGDYVKINKKATIVDSEEVIDTFIDKASLKKDASGLCGKPIDDYWKLYSAVTTKNTTDKKVHAKVVEKDWAKRGITFSNNKKIKLITVWFHNKTMDNKDLLAVGHVGVAIKTNDGYCFIEKIAFQEPYNAIKFSSIKKLNEYIMAKYDNSWGQDTAAPFIMVNDKAYLGK